MTCFSDVFRIRPFLDGKECNVFRAKPIFTTRIKTSLVNKMYSQFALLTQLFVWNKLLSSCNKVDEANRLATSLISSASDVFKLMPTSS